MNDNSDPRPSATIHYLTQKPMPLDERELPEWLQREQDAIREEEARGRLTVGATVMLLVMLALFAINAWLGQMGYGG